MSVLPVRLAFFLPVCLCLVLVIPARAGIERPPAITSVAVDPANLDVVLIQMDCMTCAGALSTDAGRSFRVISESDIPVGLSSNLTFGARQYVLGGTDCLLRTDNGGTTWISTKSQEFIRLQKQTERSEAEEQYRAEYGSMIPKRSPYWHLVFGLFAVGYLSSTLFAFRRMGWVRACYTVLQGFMVFIVIWVIHSFFHEFFWTQAGRTFYPPSVKLVIAMAVTARPLPLLVYLLFLWPLLPGSMQVLAGVEPSATPTRRKRAYAWAVTSGILFAGFHLHMVFFGFFWD